MRLYAAAFWLTDEEREDGRSGTGGAVDDVVEAVELARGADVVAGAGEAAVAGEMEAAERRQSAWERGAKQDIKRRVYVPAAAPGRSHGLGGEAMLTQVAGRGKKADASSAGWSGAVRFAGVGGRPTSEGGERRRGAPTAAF